MIGNNNNFFFLIAKKNYCINKNQYFLGSNAYQELIKILKHPDFCASELPLSITTLKQMRSGLPLMTLNSHNVKINPMDTSSTTISQKEGYIFSLIDHIQRILKNPLLFPNMYFGPGVEVSEITELWHGQIWKESPMFGETSLLINNSTYHVLI
jgi:hypothetical protein